MEFSPASLPTAERLLRGGALLIGLVVLPYLLGRVTVASVGVMFGALMLALAAWTFLGIPVAYRLTDGPAVVVERRALPSVTYQLTGGVERFHDIEALRRRKDPSGIVTPGAGTWAAGTHLTGEKGVRGDYKVFERYSTQRDLVRLEVNGGTLLVSPAEPQRFVEAVRSAAA